ncbi:MAG: limonene,2-epoxide hydrolase [Actinomycetota bacterium]|nr:limonene,2-epoxide hydrolase [Actinomycetota bacterium]
MSPTAVVRRFCAAWRDDLSSDDLAAVFADDAVHHSMPLAPAVGRAAIATTFRDVGSARATQERDCPEVSG